MTECMYPVREPDDDSPEPPEYMGSEWRTSETCEHDWCIDVAGWTRQWNAERGQRESLAIARADLDMPFASESELMAAIQVGLK